MQPLHHFNRISFVNIVEWLLCKCFSKAEKLVWLHFTLSGNDKKHKLPSANWKTSYYFIVVHEQGIHPMVYLASKHVDSQRQEW